MRTNQGKVYFFRLVLNSVELWLIFSNLVLGFAFNDTPSMDRFPSVYNESKNSVRYFFEWQNAYVGQYRG